MMKWFRRLPLTVRLPLLVSVMIFVAAVVTTQIIIYGLSMQFENQMKQVADVYLDGLSAALVPSVLADDRDGIKQALDQALKFHVGVVENRLLYLDESGAEMVQSFRESKLPSPPLPDSVSRTPSGMFFDQTNRSLWAWRALGEPAGEQNRAATGTVVANLDLSKFLAERSHIHWSLTGIDLLISTLCAIFGFVLARQVQRPVALLTQHLESVTRNGPQPVPAGKIPSDDPQTASLIQAFNRMANESQERTSMLAQLAEQEKIAVLGRMAATLAHEVRNPLGGVLTALSTLRKFGNDPQAQRESIDFIERGLLAIQGVTDAALKTYRPPVEARSFGAEDLLDIQRLVEGRASERNVSIKMDIQLPDRVPVSATEVRQILLNLLLNAIQATQPGGSVTLRGRTTESELLLEVIDEGVGLSSDVASRLEQGKLLRDRPGLGVDVIVRLMERLQGRVSVNARPDGTKISLHMPIMASVEPSHE